jgi:hypothetical protein
MTMMVIRAGKIVLIVGSWLVLGYVVAIVLGAVMLLWALSASEPDFG